MKTFCCTLLAKFHLFPIKISAQQNSPCLYEELSHLSDSAQYRGSGGYNYVQYVNSDFENVLNDYVCPVVVHIIHNNGSENISDCQVIAAIDQANEQLEYPYDSHIKLKLALLDPFGNPTTGIEHIQTPLPVVNPVDETDPCALTDLELKQLSFWPQERYINIWVVQKIRGNDFGDCADPSTAAGYVSNIPLNESNDGIVILYSAFGNTEQAANNEINWVHELGHYFYLFHVWGEYDNICDNCHLMADCLISGDMVCDWRFRANCTTLSALMLPDPGRSIPEYSNEQ